MTRKKYILLWLIPLCMMGVMLLVNLYQPQWLLADGLSDVIREGSTLPEVIDQLSHTENYFPEASGNTAEKKIDRVTLTVINMILYICGTAAGVMIIVGGIRYVMSAGNDDMMNGAKSTILYAAGGLLAIILAWAIVLNVVRIASLEERLDYSESPLSGSCDPNVVMFCGGECCGCTSSNNESEFGCDEGLQCGGPMDVVLFEDTGIEDTIRVCQPIPE